MQYLSKWMKTAILLGGLLLPAAAQTPAGSPSPSSAESTPQAQPGTVPEMKDEIQKMRVILNQMRNNLAFVGNTTTPLAHQFQLDIDMWQALLDHMQQQQEQKPPR
jgi:hypothetical protein